MSDVLSRLKKLTKCLHIYIAETPGRGFGIFAARAFPLGSTLVVDEDGDYYAGVMTLAEAQARGYDLSQDLFQIGTDAFLLPNANLDDFVNHSCDPNTGLQLTAAGYRMIALRDIARGDELTYDYSTYISGTPERMSCACGAANCRGTIGAFETLPPALQDRYLAAGVVGRFVAAAARNAAIQDAARAESGAGVRAGGEAVSA
ncbi:MAG: SET domain-containing protein-lysine N-methyltransferase [Geminicoccaceae bacterium]